MNDRKTLNEKFKTAYPILRTDFPTHTKTDIASVMGTYTNVLNDILNGTRNLTYGMLSLLIKNFELNRAYFLEDSKELYKKQPRAVTPPIKFDRRTSSEFKKAIKIEEIINDVGERFKLIRELLDKSQDEMGTAVGTNQHGWFRIESNNTRPSDEVKRILHQKYGISYDFMLDGVKPIVMASLPAWVEMDNIDEDVRLALQMVRSYELSGKHARKSITA